MYVDRQDFIALSGADPTGIRNVMRRWAEANGIVGQTLLRSYAYPNKFTVVRRWESIEAALAAAGADLPHTAPFTRSRFEGFETVVDVASDKLAEGDVRVVQFADWELSSIAKAGAYETSRRELFALQKEHVDGFVSAQLQRSAGVPTKFLMVIQFTSREATGGGGRIPRSAISWQPTPPPTSPFLPRPSSSTPLLTAASRSKGAG